MSIKGRFPIYWDEHPMPGSNLLERASNRIWTQQTGSLTSLTEGTRCAEREETRPADTVPVQEILEDGIGATTEEIFS